MTFNRLLILATGYWLMTTLCPAQVRYPITVTDGATKTGYVDTVAFTNAAGLVISTNAAGRRTATLALPAAGGGVQTNDSYTVLTGYPYALTNVYGSVTTVSNLLNGVAASVMTVSNGLNGALASITTVSNTVNGLVASTVTISNSVNGVSASVGSISNRAANAVTYWTFVSMPSNSSASYVSRGDFGTNTFYWGTNDVTGAGAGGDSNWVAVASATVTASVSSITVETLFGDGSNDALRIVLTTKSTATGSEGAWVRLNGDGGANYDCGYMYFAYTNSVIGGSTLAQTALFLGKMPGQGASSLNLGTIDLLISRFSGTNWWKSTVGHSTCINGTPQNVHWQSYQIAGMWHSTSAVTNLLFLTDGGNWTNGTTVTVYHMKATP